jgi:hypothetical protein
MGAKRSLTGRCQVPEWIGLDVRSNTDNARGDHSGVGLETRSWSYRHWFDPCKTMNSWSRSSILTI